MQKDRSVLISLVIFHVYVHLGLFFVSQFFQTPPPKPCTGQVGIENGRMDGWRITHMELTGLVSNCNPVSYKGGQWAVGTLSWICLH